MSDSVGGPARPRSFNLLMLAVVLAAGIIIGFLFRGSGDAPSGATTETDTAHAEELRPGTVEVPEAAQRNAGLKTAKVERRQLPATIESTGAVAADESRVGHIRPLARGVVETINARLGDRVAQGQALVTYDNIELGELVGEYLSEAATLRQTEANLEVSRQALDRSEELIKLEAVAQQTLELRRAEFKNAESAVASQRARVSKVEEQLHRFGLSEAEVNRLSPQEGGSSHRTASHSVLRAPFAGVVTKFDVATGAVVDPEHELMTVSDVSTVWVLADVYEKDLAKIKVDSDVMIRVDAYPDRTFRGRLTYVSDVIDPQTRTAKVRCVVDNRDGALKLDMFAKVSILTLDSQEGIVVPTEAVQQIDGIPVVFVRASPVRFVRRNVEVGVTAGGLVQIKSGIKLGEEIATAGSFYLKTAALRDRIGEEH